MPKSTLHPCASRQPAANRIYWVNEKNKTPARAHLRAPRNIFPYTTFGPGVVRARGACCADADRGLLCGKAILLRPTLMPFTKYGWGWRVAFIESYITYKYAHVAEIIGGGSRWDLNCECHPSSPCHPHPMMHFYSFFLSSNSPLLLCASARADAPRAQQTRPCCSRALCVLAEITQSIFQLTC